MERTIKQDKNWNQPELSFKVGTQFSHYWVSDKSPYVWSFWIKLGLTLQGLA